MTGYRIWISVVVAALLIGTAPDLALAEMAESELPDNATTAASVSLGYRGVGSEDNAGLALEYDSLESSALFKAKLTTDTGKYHLDLGVDYLNEDDYAAEVHLNSKALLYLDLSTQRFYHNLDHIPYDNGYRGGEAGPPLIRVPTAAPADGSRPDALFPSVPTTSYTTPDFTTPAGTMNPAYNSYYSDQDPANEYGLRLDMSEAKLKLKLPDYPAHVVLSYWRYEKEGEKQLRFVDESCATACHMQSKTRDIDRITEEFKAGVDAHVGFIDVALEGLLRTFRDREPIPVDDFGANYLAWGQTFNDHQHDEDPDSKLKELTLKLNTAPSGGLVGSASFTLGERENQSDLSAPNPVEATTDYYKTAADVTYTPGEKWTVNFRYRLLDLDADNTDAFEDYYAPDDDLQVRQAIDITRAWYEAAVNYRPFRSLTLKAELSRQDIDRSNTGTPTTVQDGFGHTITDTWELPDEETITRVKLGFNSRLLEKSALKLNGWVTYQENDGPAYGTSFAESLELFVATSYNPSPFWGLMANANLLTQENNDHELYDVSLDQEKQQQNVSLGTWVNPRDGLSFDLNYGFFRTAIDQDQLYGTVDGYMIKDDSAGYRQTVHSITAGMTWQALEKLSCRLEGYLIRSKANWDPDFGTETFAYPQYASPTDIYYFPAEASSSDLRDISELDIRQNGVRARANWQIDEKWACSAEATFDKYDEIGDDTYDGSAQTCLISFSRSW